MNKFSEIHCWGSQLFFGIKVSENIHFQQGQNKSAQKIPPVLISSRAKKNPEN